MVRFPVRIAAALLMPVSLGACSGILDDFKFDETEDDYTKQVTATATAEQKGDVDKDANLQLTLTCSYTKGDKADPIQNAKLAFLVLDKKGDPYTLTDLSYKFDDGEVVESGVINSIDQSKYKNEVESLFFNFAAGNLNANPLAYMSIAENASVDDQEFEDKVKNAYLALGNLKKISVRYETVNGMQNTAEFNVTGGNFAKVQKICGWESMPAKYSERLKNGAKKKKDQEAAAAAAAAEAAAAAAAEYTEAEATDAAAEATDAAAAY